MSKTIIENFSQSALDYDRYADIQGLMGEELLGKITSECAQAKNILDVGCGTGGFTQKLKNIFPFAKTTGLDLSLQMCQNAKSKNISCLAADARLFPFKNDSFDLIVSNAAYQWVEDLEKAFLEVKNALCEGGFFIFNCLGTDTLRELRDSFRIGGNLLPGREKIFMALESCGFQDVRQEVSHKEKKFDNTQEILLWLKKTGANRIQEKPFFLTPQRLELISAYYQKNYSNGGGVYATFEVITVKARKSSL